MCCSHNRSVAPSAVNAHSSGWKGNPPGLPQSTCVPVVQDACCVLQSGAEQSQGRGLWGCWDRREGMWLTRESSPAWFCIFSVPSSAFSLQKRIAECQYWPVEVCRMPVVSSSKGKTSKADKVKMEGLCCSGLWDSTVLLSVFFQCLCYTKTSLEPAKASQRAGGFVKGLISLIELLNKQRIRFLPYSLQISHRWSVLAWWRGVGGRLLFEK